MRQLLTLVTIVAAQAAAAPQAGVVLDNARVRIFRIGASPAGVEHRPAVVIRLDSGDAVWTEDAARSTENVGRPTKPSDVTRGVGASTVIVEPKNAPPTAGEQSGTAPGSASFTGMSFKPIFENDKVRVIRARMEVGAREGFHTHGSDTVVVHLSGGEIEDTANGRTAVNKWKPGDVEFEARGSSHSARNVGQAIDVVLVALK